MIVLPAGLGSIGPAGAAGASWSSLMAAIGSDLWGWWKLDENPPASGGVCTDYSGNARHGTYSADTFTTGAAVFNSSARSPNFVAANTQYVQIPTFSVGSAFSVGIRFRTTSNVLQNFFSADNGTNRGWHLRMNALKVEAVVIVPSTVVVTSPSNYNDGNNHFAVFTFDPAVAAVDGRMKLYVDGSNVAQSNTAVTMTSTTVTPYIGRRGAGSDNYFTGNANDAFLVTRALSPSEISALYAARNNP